MNKKNKGFEQGIYLSIFEAKDHKHQFKEQKIQTIMQPIKDVAIILFNQKMDMMINQGYLFLVDILFPVSIKQLVLKYKQFCYIVYLFKQMIMNKTFDMLTAPEIPYFHSSASTSDEDDEGHLGDGQKNKKLKNQLCKNFLNTGYCRYYDKCQFAHGIEELRQSQRTNLKYKTKECQSYFIKGCCQYGQRCNFLHRKKEQSQTEKREKLRVFTLNFNEVLMQESKLMRILKKE